MVFSSILSKSKVWIDGRVGPRAGLDGVEKKEKSLASAGNPTLAEVKNGGAVSPLSYTSS
jgi:hypothetical protein